jgi:hypothetical protein
MICDILDSFDTLSKSFFDITDAADTVEKTGSPGLLIS